MNESVDIELAEMFSEGADWRTALAEACWPGAAFTRVEELAPWQPGGSETYCHHLMLVTPLGSRRLLVKAFIPFPGTIDVDEAVRRTVERTCRIANAGLRVPSIFAQTSSSILTEYVAESLTDALRRDASGTAAEAARYLIALARAGIDASRCVHDLRFDNGKACLVDFGSDLHVTTAETEGRIARRALGSLARTLEISSKLTPEEVHQATQYTMDL